MNIKSEKKMVDSVKKVQKEIKTVTENLVKNVDDLELKLKVLNDLGDKCETRINEINIIKQKVDEQKIKGESFVKEIKDIMNNKLNIKQDNK